MKLTYARLRQVINEVMVSPSLLKNNKRTDDPFQNKNMQAALVALKNSFQRGLEVNMLHDSAGKFDQETGELDDAEYGAIRDAAQEAAESMIADVHELVTRSWNGAAPASGRRAA